MKLYYTGANNFKDTQTDPRLSLGGYISSSEVANDTVGALFSSLSQRALQNPQVETKAVALYNDSDITKTYKIYYTNDSANPITSYKMAFALPATTDCGEQYVEKIDSANQLPVNASWIDNRTNDNAVYITVQPQSYVVLWISRYINVSKVRQTMNCDVMSADTPIENHKFTVKIKSQFTSSQWFFDTENSKYAIYYTTDPTDIRTFEFREPIKIVVDDEINKERARDKTVQQLKTIVESRGEIKVTALGNPQVLEVEILTNVPVNPPTSTDNTTFKIVTNFHQNNIFDETLEKTSLIFDES